MRFIKTIIAVAMSLCAVCASAQTDARAAATMQTGKAPQPASITLGNHTDSISTAIATVMGPLINKNLVQLRGLGLDIDNTKFVEAIGVYLNGNYTGFTPESGDRFIEDCVRALHPEMRVDTVSVKSQQEYVDAAAALPGAVRLPDGEVLVVLQEGEGAMPVDGDKVEVSYTGKLSDGTEFDSTVDEGPVTFDVNGVVPGFAAGLRNMKPGGTYRVVIPSNRAYGARGIPGAIPGNAALDFTVTLIRVIPGAK